MNFSHTKWNKIPVSDKFSPRFTLNPCFNFLPHEWNFIHKLFVNFTTNCSPFKCHDVVIPFGVELNRNVFFSLVYIPLLLQYLVCLNITKCLGISPSLLFNEKRKEKCGHFLISCIFRVVTCGLGLAPGRHRSPSLKAISNHEKWNYLRNKLSILVCAEVWMQPVGNTKIKTHFPFFVAIYETCIDEWWKRLFSNF